MMDRYFKRLYRRTMQEAYSFAYDEITTALQYGGSCLDCGANDGQKIEVLRSRLNKTIFSYTGLEWSWQAVEAATAAQRNVLQGDLNKPLPFSDGTYRCIFGLSVLEHLLRPCRFLQECHRLLESDGTLVILTPNISTYFTALLVLLGRMPSSGPHPDSDALIKQEEVFRVSEPNVVTDAENDTPVHRHLVVFSMLVLQKYFRMIGFREVTARGFGLYPFPNFSQPLMERLDPYHCHQMVIVAKK